MTNPTRRLLLAAAPALLLPIPALSRGAPPEVQAELPGAQLQGSGRMRWFGLSLYDARLWAAQRPGPERWTATPLALELQYARGFEGRAIAERSLQEMRRQREITEEQAGRWLERMVEVFPDVREGDRITGVKRPGELARFFVNGRLLGDVRDAEFARLFFGIWLAPQTSGPELREALLGLGRAGA